MATKTEFEEQFLLKKYFGQIEPQSTDHIISYKDFLQKLVNSADPLDELPVSVPKYRFTCFEIEGAIINWSKQYLEARECPSPILIPIIRSVVDEVHKDPESEIMSNSDTLTAPKNTIKFMQCVIRNLIKVCEQYLNDESVLQKLPPPPEISVPISISCHRNARRTMEDRCCVVEDLNALFNIEEHGSVSFYGVYDGHAGYEAAQYSASYLHQYVAESTHYPHDIPAALREAFLKTDKCVLDKCKTSLRSSGTTAVVAVVDHQDNMLYVAWVGDSEAAISLNGTAVPLVNPHKASRTDEQNRIAEMGGVVMFYGDCWRVEGKIAVSRAIGDRSCKPFVCAEPDFNSIQLDGTEEVLVLGSDGLWDVLLADAVVKEVLRELVKGEDPTGISHHLVQKARNKGSLDNITVLVIYLKPPEVIAQSYTLDSLGTDMDEWVRKMAMERNAILPVDHSSKMNHIFNHEVDFGPETDVDGVDTNNEPVNNFSVDHLKETASINESLVVNLSAEALKDERKVVAEDNANNSEEEEEEEEGWDYIKGESKEQLLSKIPDLSKTQSDDMDHPLNPNAAEFVPTSPTSPVEKNSFSVTNNGLSNNVPFTPYECKAAFFKNSPGDSDLLSHQNEKGVSGVTVNGSEPLSQETDVELNGISCQKSSEVSKENEVDVNENNSDVDVKSFEIIKPENPFLNDGERPVENNTSNLAENNLERYSPIDFSCNLASTPFKAPSSMTESFFADAADQKLKESDNDVAENQKNESNLYSDISADTHDFSSSPAMKISDFEYSPISPEKSHEFSLLDCSETKAGKNLFGDQNETNSDDSVKELRFSDGPLETHLTMINSLNSPSHIDISNPVIESQPKISDDSVPHENGFDNKFQDSSFDQLSAGIAGLNEQSESTVGIEINEVEDDHVSESVQKDFLEKSVASDHESEVGDPKTSSEAIGEETKAFDLPNDTEFDSEAEIIDNHETLPEAEISSSVKDFEFDRKEDSANEDQTLRPSETSTEPESTFDLNLSAGDTDTSKLAESPNEPIIPSSIEHPCEITESVCNKPKTTEQSSIIDEIENAEVVCEDKETFNTEISCKEAASESELFSENLDKASNPFDSNEFKVETIPEKVSIENFESEDLSKSEVTREESPVDFNKVAEVETSFSNDFPQVNEDAVCELPKNLVEPEIPEIVQSEEHGEDIFNGTENAVCTLTNVTCSENEDSKDQILADSEEEKVSHGVDFKETVVAENDDETTKKTFEADKIVEDNKTPPSTPALCTNETSSNFGLSEAVTKLVAEDAQKETAKTATDEEFSDSSMIINKLQEDYDKAKECEKSVSDEMPKADINTEAVAVGTAAIVGVGVAAVASAAATASDKSKKPATTPTSKKTAPKVGTKAFADVKSKVSSTAKPLSSSKPLTSTQPASKSSTQSPISSPKRPVPGVSARPLSAKAPASSLSSSKPPASSTLKSKVAAVSTILNSSSTKPKTMPATKSKVNPLTATKPTLNFSKTTTSPASSMLRPKPTTTPASTTASKPLSKPIANGVPPKTTTTKRFSSVQSTISKLTKPPAQSPTAPKPLPRTVGASKTSATKNTPTLSSATSKPAANPIRRPIGAVSKLTSDKKEKEMANHQILAKTASTVPRTMTSAGKKIDVKKTNVTQLNNTNKNVSQTKPPPIRRLPSKTAPSEEKKESVIENGDMNSKDNLINTS